MGEVGGGVFQKDKLRTWISRKEFVPPVIFFFRGTKNRPACNGACTAAKRWVFESETKLHFEIKSVCVMLTVVSSDLN